MPKLNGKQEGGEKVTCECNYCRNVALPFKIHSHHQKFINSYCKTIMGMAIELMRENKLWQDREPVAEWRWRTLKALHTKHGNIKFNY